ncbi:OmpP1/FadL family transporter [Pelistega suis]|uniref:Fatty acid transporter n=1 Tax=Pelistega suis TaxID=1631957 RepID=A0A849P704_9BURK|nr:outer membrane protein transport protein [Pelistega suis]NOL52084.1 fatty acid transporter [Pelistega suis]
MNFRLRTLTASIALLGTAGVTHAAGFNLLEQNNSGLGNAYAGSAAVAENASTTYFNPAGLTQLDGLQISTGVSFIRPGFKFTDKGTTLPNNLTGAGTGFSPVPTALGNTGGDAGGWGVVPNLYMSYKLNDRVALGLGISAPFGLKTEYESDWMGRYHSRSFDIKTININPSVAFKVDPSFSVGLGLNIQRIEATYEKAVPVGTGVIPVPAGLPHPLAGKEVYLSGDAKTKVKNTGYGWNIGLLYHPSEDTRIGLSYRSRIKHKADGDTSVSFINPLTRSTTQIISDSAASVSLPDMAILSGYHRLNDKWEIMGDVSWTGWSSLPKLTITNAKLPETTLQLHFKDSWRIAVGANYAVNDAWKIKAGLAWDQSPVRHTEHRLASLPDSNRYWLSLGAQFKPTANTTLDVGYAYIIADKSKINNNNGNAAAYGTLKGSYKADSHVFGLQLSHRF